MGKITSPNMERPYDIRYNRLTLKLQITKISELMQACVADLEEEWRGWTPQTKDTRNLEIISYQFVCRNAEAIF